MTRKWSALLCVVTAATALALPARSHGQSAIIVIPRPRPHLPMNVALADSAEAANRQGDFVAATDIQRSAAMNAPKLARSVGHFPLSDGQASEVWGSQVRVLPSATLAPGSKDASLFTELGAQLSGGWRFVLGTTLSVQTGSSSSATAEDAADDSAQKAADQEFRKFLAGGGNVSLAAMRPIGRWDAGLGTHLLFLVPRGWVNIPALGNAENVTNFGGELLAEYQFQLHGNPPAGTEAANGQDEPLPFLTFHVDAGIAHGTRSFFRGIGRTNRSAFAFVSPTLDFLVQDQVKLGVTYFFGPNDFRSHQSITVALSVIPKQKSKTDSNGLR